MRTSENPYSPLQTAYDNTSCGLQVHPIKSRQNRTGSPAKRHTHRSRKRHSSTRFRRKCALSASLLLLTAASGSMLILLNTSANPLQKISSPAFFSDLDAEQPLSTTDDVQQDNKADTAGIQEGAVHITSYSEDWNLILVNPWNPVPEDYKVSLAPIQNGHYVDARCYTDLQNMLADCMSAGLSPLICSSYRTQENQQALFDERVNELTTQGYALEDAYDKAATSVAKPGTSEHQIGLAVDIVDQNYQILDSSQESTLVQQWLMENCWKYGFILRYPNGTSDLTGIIYEPWHYRYVGKKVAKKIHKQGICLEEYLAQQLE